MQVLIKWVLPTGAIREAFRRRVFFQSPDDKVEFQKGEIQETVGAKAQNWKI